VHNGQRLERIDRKIAEGMIAIDPALRLWWAKSHFANNPDLSEHALGTHLYPKSYSQRIRVDRVYYIEAI
jgi:hypothetical protein